MHNRTLSIAARLLILPVLLLSACDSQPPVETPDPRRPVIDQLVELLDRRPELGTALDQAIGSAGLAGIDSRDDFYLYLDELVTWIPVERDLVPKVIQFHYVVNQAPDDQLNTDPEFSAWMRQFVAAWGEFLDSPASAEGIKTFAAMPNYNVDDYFVGPSGWLTFNQFFAREIRPGKRPIADPRDDRVVVSPADSIFMGNWPIDAESNVVVKGVNWPVSELLDGSPFQDAFRGGSYTHSFLFVDDYHRYHTPVEGVVKEVRNIHGRVFLDVVKGEDGELAVVDGDTYQFNQERGLVVIDSPELGLVAVLPIGMSVVSSVNLTPEPGATLRKGEEFGFFLFGGSDVVMLFQDRNVEFEAVVGKKYLQGERIARRQ